MSVYRRSSRTLTLATLKAKGACEEQRRLFRKRYGASVRVTVARCRAAAQMFSFGWASDHLLSPKARTVYYKATDEAWYVYYKARAEAEGVYDKAVAEAWDVFYKTRAEAMAVRDKARAGAEAVFDKAVAGAWTVRSKAVAEAFARCYIEDEEEGV